MKEGDKVQKAGTRAELLRQTGKATLCLYPWEVLEETLFIGTARNVLVRVRENRRL